MIKHRILVWLALGGLLIGARGQAWAQQDSTDSPLDIIVQTEAESSARIGLSITRISDGAELYSHRTQELFVPASVVKVLSTGAAMRQEGPRYRFSTRIYTVGEVRGGVLHGGLLIRGGQDPSIGSRLIPGDSARLAKELYLTLRQAGISRIEGAIYIDASMHAGLGVHPSWETEDIGNAYGAGLYGFNYLDNSLDLYVTTPSKGSRRPSYTLGDSLAGISWLNDLRTRRGGDILPILTPTEPRIRLTGSLPPGLKDYHVRVANPDPAAYATAWLRASLEEQGISVSKAGARSYTGYVPEGQLLHTYHSLPLDTLSIITNHRSQNLYAEAIASILDTLHTRGGALERYWQRATGLGSADIVLSDGSGLSRGNRLSPRGLSKALRILFGGAEPDDGALVGTLPQVGLEGTVRRLMPSEDITAYLKSGSMRGVACYAGYVYYGGEWYTLVYLSNGFDSAAASRRVLTDFLRSIFPQS